MCTCSCGFRHIARIRRRLSSCIKVHWPTWLQQGGVKSIFSSVLAHLIFSGHRIETNVALEIIQRGSNCTTKGLCVREPNTAETVAIGLSRPELCAPKRFVHISRSSVRHALILLSCQSLSIGSNQLTPPLRTHRLRFDLITFRQSSYSSATLE